MDLHLVTGGAGFVGSALAELLYRSGQKVRVLDLHIPEAPIDGVEYVRGDILSDTSLKYAMSGVTTVHHAAAAVPLHRRKKEFHSINFEGTKNTFLAAKNAGVNHFCHMSSSAVYGLVSSSDCPLKSDFKPKPFEFYGKSKLAADQFIIESQLLSGAPTYSILRPRTVIGPGRLGVLQLLFEWIRLDCDVFLPGSGGNKFQLLDVRDLAQASVAASMRKRQGIFLLGSEVFGTLFEDLTALCKYAKSSAQVRQVHSMALAAVDLFNRVGFSPLSSWHLKASQHDLFFDLTESKRELGWTPQYSNQQTLSDAFDWYIANRIGIVNQSTRSIHQRPLNWGILALTKLGRKRTEKTTATD